MHLKWYPVSCAILSLFLLAGSVSAGENGAADLLRRAEASSEPPTRCAFTFTVDGTELSEFAGIKRAFVEECSVKLDGGRWLVDSTTWDTSSAESEREFISETHQLCDEHGFVRFFVGQDSHGFVSIHTNESSGSALKGQPIFVVFGHAIGDTRSLFEILREPKTTLGVRAETATVEGYRCHILDAANTHGRYTLWICPDLGDSLVKIRLEKEPENSWYRGKLGDVPQMGKEARDRAGPLWQLSKRRLVQEISLAEISKRATRWMPSRATSTVTIDYAEGRQAFLSWNLTLQDIDLGPDFSSPELFKLSIPDDTPVFNENCPQIPMRWKDGMPVPDVDGPTIQQIERDVKRYR